MPKRSASVLVSSKRKAHKNALGRIVRNIVTTMEERKFFQHKPIADNFSPVGANWTINSLLYDNANVGIVQGLTVNDRIGNRIKLDGIDLMIRVIPNPAGMDTTGGLCRIVIFHNKKHTSAAATAAQVFSMPAGATPLINALQNPVYEDRITIHHDFLHQFSFAGRSGTAGADVATAAAEGVYKIHIPAKTLIEYNSASGGEAFITNDCWNIATIADQGTVCCTLTTNCIVRFTDP